MSGARPGWYPDPGGAPDHYRWWDGQDWTDAVGESPHAPEPVRARAVRKATPVRSTLRTAGAWTIGIAVLAVAGVILGLVIWQDPSHSSDRSGAELSPRPSTSGVPGELDQDSREATIGTASMTLPDEPYRVRNDPMQAKSLFDSYFVAGATVHEDYLDRRDWSAVVGLAHVAPGASRDDPEATALAVTYGIAGRFFDGRPTTVSEPSVAEHSVDGCSGVQVSAEVSYRIAGLASRADRVTVVLIRLDDGTEVAAFSSVPTDASPSLRNLAAESLDSLHVG